MAKTIILDDEFATLWFHEREKIVHHEFHKFIFGEPFHKVLNEALRVMKETGSEKWLSDDRKNAAISQEDQEWLAKEWRPKALESGWKYWAVVLPEKTVGRLSILRIFDTYREKTAIVADTFDDPTEAFAWLLQQ